MPPQRNHLISHISSNADVLKEKAAEKKRKRGRKKDAQKSKFGAQYNSIKVKITMK